MDYIVPDNFYKFKSDWYQNIDFDYESELLLDVLNQASKENDIQSYIKENEKWFIPASIFEDYDLGHHEACIIPEQRLGAEYRADYMLLGRNSIGHHIVLIEFENVNVDYKVRTSNMESESVRKGIVQIKDWKRWMDDNRKYFMESCGLTNISGNIPIWGIHYCLVVSRRDRMDNTANQMRGQTQYETPALHIVTYDRLVDNVKKLSNGF
ncbi:Shedu anti-phage system protein SduA domain-containing protein [Kineothrix sp. MB12-C1]|uniref:Shedu anti-phage system protein SduA domain-containing protein n=1 Tax=Kineothrix sp. MB12-C1 TaxID=3070215 RepID=UPI0027D275D6|nr:Shedu anti-phage system protein SduA domain-containing protein [Kineothrix sp. MB12-C1]WMC92352.1 DUF4263 domain-containing protein [Kineothrix sp. MB12-C1]